MAQKYVKYQNTNTKSAAYGKYFARAVYPKHWLETEDLATLIEGMTTVNHTDVVAVLNGLGTVMSYSLKRGEKIRLKDIGTFKVGFSSLGVNNVEDFNAKCIHHPRVLFVPETIHIPKGEPSLVIEDDKQKVKQPYTSVKKMLEGIVFEETYDNAMNVKPEPEP